MKTVYRLFSIRKSPNSLYDVLFVQSTFEGEYGPVIMQTSVDLNSSILTNLSAFTETSGERLESLYAFRTHEIAYIFTHIVPLFNPLNLFKDEIPQESPAQNAQ